MIFEIEFNRTDDNMSFNEKNVILQELGATLDVPSESYPRIEVGSLDDLERIEKKLYELTGKYYSLIIGFDSPTIFLDKDV